MAWLAVLIRIAVYFGTPVLILARAGNEFSRFGSDITGDGLFTIGDIWFALQLGLGLPSEWVYEAAPSAFTFFQINYFDYSSRAWLGLALWILSGWIALGVANVLDDVVWGDGNSELRKWEELNKRPKD